VSAGDPFVSDPDEGSVQVIVIGADTHKHLHTVAAVGDGTGRVLADVTVRARRRSFDDLRRWARGLGHEQIWALEDCRHVSGALGRFLLVCGERVVRVSPKLACGVDPARTACAA
jgi:transposase